MRAEIAAERAAGVTTVGVIGFSAGGHLAGHVALDGAADFAVLGYPVVSMVSSALRRHAVPHELHVFERGVHGLGLAAGSPAERWQDLCATWLAGR